MAVSKNIYGTPGSDVRASTAFTPKVTGETKTTVTDLTKLQTSLAAELSIRGIAAVSWTSANNASVITWAQINQVKNAIGSVRTSDANAGRGSASDFGFDATTQGTPLNAGWIYAVQTYVNTMQARCICNCNYCTCNCNHCPCDCNHCPCNCNHCPCNCNHCPCNCNHCPCNCNHKCTCNCNY